VRMGAVVAVVTVVAVWALRREIVGLYTSDAAVGVMALSLLPFLAAFHFFDAIQTVVGFVLRAHKIVVPPTVIYAVALWGVGVFGGYQLAFRGVGGPPWGIAGMWLMQSIALAMAAVLLVAFYLWIVQRVAKTVVRPVRSNVST